MTVTIGLQTLSLGYFLNYEVSRGQLGFRNVPLLFGLESNLQ